jgi:quercetin dioxygenase-like cupin family protein
MARPGEAVYHPAFAVRLRFLQTAAKTNGELLQVEVTLPPGFLMPEHVHPTQEERHEVLSGTLRARIGGQQRDYKAGERVVGPPGVPHAWRNPSDHDDLRIVSEHRPVLHMEQMLEVGSQIARDVSNHKKAVLKHALRAAVLLNDVKSDFYLTSWWLRALMFSFVPLAVVGSVLGIRAAQSTAD